MAKIQTLKNKDNATIYPQTHTKAIYNAEGVNLETILDTFLIADTAAEMEDIVSLAELQSNKVTAINAYSTDIQYPTAKAVHTAIMENASAKITMSIVDTLPAEGNTSTIYLVPETDSDAHAAWIYAEGTWAQIGTTSIDLTEYTLAADHAALVASTEEHINTALTGVDGVHGLRYENGILKILNTETATWDNAGTSDYNNLLNKPEIYTKAEIDALLGDYESTMTNLLDGYGI